MNFSANNLNHPFFNRNLASAAGHHQMSNGTTGEFVGNTKIVLGSPYYTLSRVLLNTLLDKTFKEELLVQKMGANANEDIMELHAHIVSRDREVRWILAMSRKFHLGLGTTGLAIAIVDRMLRMISVQGKYVHCLGVAALGLAVKFHEEIDAHSEAFEASREAALMLAIPSPDPLNADDLAAKIRATSFFSKQELNRMERALLSKMGWDMLLPSFDRFLQAMLAVIGAPHLAASSILRRNFEVVISSGALVWRYSPPILALSLLSIMLELSTSIASAQWPRITESLRTIFQIESAILAKCRREMGELLAADSSKNRWAHGQIMEISTNQQQRKKHRKKQPSNHGPMEGGGKHRKKAALSMFEGLSEELVEEN